MNVKWYYRQSEVPDSVYQHLVQDRNNENGKTAPVCVWQKIHQELLLRVSLTPIICVTTSGYWFVKFHRKRHLA